MKVKKIMAVFLTFVMLVGMLPAMVFADSDAHDWQLSSRREPTCTEGGIAFYICTVHMGESRTETLPALGHSWGGWTVTQAATCVSAGTQVRTCSRCGETETQTIPATGQHSWGGWTQTKAPTCAAEGTQIRTCSVCGTQETQSIPATGNHSWGSWTQTKAASCTAGGEETHKCSVCGKSETRATAALGHKWGGWSVTKAASCTAEGTEVRTCSRDGAKETRSIPKTAHSWGAWKTTREATCDKTGVEEHRCSVCGLTETRDIPKKPHTYGEWKVEKEPTCTEEGKQTRVCKVCGYVDTQSIAKLPHTFGEWTVTLEPTCTAEGEHTHTCEVCGQEETENIPMIPHDFGEWVILSQLTDFSVGIRERTCKMCGLLEHEETEPSGILRFGDKGEGVKDLQEALNEAGYDCGAADGSFGPKTEAAVKGLQEDLNKDPDGVGWPGLEKILIDSLEYEEDLRLSVKLVSDAFWYGEGDVAIFEAELENTSDMDIDVFTLYQMSDHDENTPNWLGLFGGEKIPAGESRTIQDLKYTVTAADAAAGHVLVSFYVSADAAGGKTLYSNQEDLGLVTQAPGPEIELFADEVAVLPFIEDAEFTVSVTLINHSAAPVALDEIFLDESIGSISKEPWMSGLLTPEVPYQFAYTGKILFYEEGMPWAYRTISAKLHDPESGEEGSPGTHIFLANRVEGPSVMLIADDTTGMGGDVGDIISLPLVAINNGTVDLKVTDISGNYPTDIAEYDPKYNTLFPAGEGFAFRMNVQVLSHDAYTASQQDPSGPCFFDRFILLRAAPAEGGEELIDDEYIPLWFNGAMPGLTLAMHQTTPDQATWSPNESGHIADMEYSGIVKNTGERPLTVTNLHAYMYPETEAAFIVSSFETPVLLNPGETHSFTAVLPIDTGNITPGSANESVDGVIEVMFGMVGEDPAEGGAMTATRYDSENITFTYKVKKDAYSWAPPSEEEITEETFDDSVFVLKNITSHSQVQGPYHTDLYGEGETITYEISIQSIADEELYDVQLIDRIGGEETVVATLPQLNKEDGYLSFPYTYVVTAADVEAGEVENHAYATYRVGNSAERVKSYEDVAFASTIDMKVPDGEKSEDLEVTKTASGNPSESNGSYAADDEVTYLITVANNSEETISNIEVVDEKSETGTVGTIAELSPGMSETVSFVYTVTAADVTNGKVQNVATAKWTSGNENRYVPSNICTIST
ncbi:MAG: peptidoglycan-binding protein, partial [Blautia sp.]|nr:peptidoglycan-binding protein [Blautia sp.]